MMLKYTKSKLFFTTTLMIRKTGTTLIRCRIYNPLYLFTFHVTIFVIIDIVAQISYTYQHNFLCIIHLIIRIIIFNIIDYPTICNYRTLKNINSYLLSQYPSNNHQNDRHKLTYSLQSSWV